MISALIAYRTTLDGWRDAAWNLEVRPFLELVCDEVIVETPLAARDGSPDDFNKPAAINAARARARGDVLLIGDADTHPGAVGDMVRLLNTPWKHVPWVLPQRYVKLTEAATREYLYAPARAGRESDYEWVGYSRSWSGGVVCRADDFDTCGGYDERFASWGADDVAFAMTMNALVGPVERHPCACYHYWHPGAENRAQPGDQHDLMYRYLDAAAISADAVRAVRFGA